MATQDGKTLAKAWIQILQLQVEVVTQKKRLDASARWAKDLEMRVQRLEGIAPAEQQQLDVTE